MRLPAVILALLCLAAAAPREAKLPEHYRDPAGRFAADYPSRWTVGATDKGALTVLTSPPEYKGDAFQETVGVGVERYADGKAPTPAEARSALARQMRARGAILTDSDGRAKLAGRDAHRFTWILDANGLRLTVVQLLTLDKNRLFVVTFTTQSGHEHIYRNPEQAMLDSFQIDPPAPATRPNASPSGDRRPSGKEPRP